ncbi:hypothetical protein [Hymenobacter sp. AT01-02]|uniref:hypothetical protein n=1 Tax=Hymenobacter sp. AT01-02 TaxID=1571877 RepID=UPI00069681BE|nr:hypothetical protein [Hymenobacter sp. AT01-02]
MNGLDIFSAERILELLGSYRSQCLTFVSSHNLAHIEKIATHLLILDDSEVKYWGSMADFLRGREAYLNDALLQLLHPASTSAQDLTWLTTER